MGREKELELNQDPEKIVLSEEELIQSGKAVGSAFVAGISGVYGAAAGPVIAKGLDYKVRTGLEKHLENFPGANKNLVRQILEGIIAELRGKS